MRTVTPPGRIRRALSALRDRIARRRAASDADAIADAVDRGQSDGGAQAAAYTAVMNHSAQR